MSDQFSSPQVARVDGAHVIRPTKRDLPLAEQPSMPALRAMAGQLSDGSSEQLIRQADELGEYLRSQQLELDRRESTYNARAAAMENEMRVARLMYREREAGLRVREEEFERRMTAIQDRTAEFKSVEESIRRESDLVTQQCRSAAEQANEARHRWEQRLTQLDKSEQLLQAQMSDLNHERQRLEQERSQLVHERRNLQQQFDMTQRKTKAELDRKHIELSQRAKEIERRQAAARQLHMDVARMHREAMEMRLCTEELWGKLTEQVSPAELTKSLAEMRRKLAGQFQLANQSLAQQRQELKELIGKLAEHQNRVSKQRQEVQTWVARRNAEIEEQAARLVEREQQLENQKPDLQYLEKEIERQRHQYEQEIRRLKNLVSSS
ncbi:MAG: hypothetical protein R3E01_32140 [Pirellulaceae bacterium]|nr:hypothetical protein [Planctomycetales bacterium]